jgi:hypothetical protein
MPVQAAEDVEERHTEIVGNADAPEEFFHEVRLLFVTTLSLFTLL